MKARIIVAAIALLATDNTYEVEYDTMKMLVGLALAPDNKISSFNLRPR